VVFSIMTALKAGVGGVVSTINAATEFVVVPRANSRDMLKNLGIDPNALQCGFCHNSLSDLSHLRALYRLDGHFVASCDKFECAILARDQLLE